MMLRAALVAAVLLLLPPFIGGAQAQSGECASMMSFINQLRGQIPHEPGAAAQDDQRALNTYTSAYNRNCTGGGSGSGSRSPGGGGGGGNNTAAALGAGAMALNDLADLFDQLDQAERQNSAARQQAIFEEMLRDAEERAALAKARAVAADAKATDDVKRQAMANPFASGVNPFAAKPATKPAAKPAAPPPKQIASAAPKAAAPPPKPAATGASLSSGDPCGSILAGASLSGYDGRWGGYDADGNCHIRGGPESSNGNISIISQADCQRLTGGLFLRYAGDSGADFTDCVFRAPATRTAASQQPPRGTPQRGSSTRPDASRPDTSRPDTSGPGGGGDGAPPPGADPGTPDSEVPLADARATDCNEDLPGSLYTTGPIGFWCTQTDIAHLEATHDVEERKLVARACGRGDTVDLASHSARARAMQLMFSMKLDMEGKLHADQLNNERMVSDASYVTCVRF